MAKLFIEDLKLAGRRVLMRVDFNVPVKDGKVENDKRLRASLPSLRYVLDQGARLVLMSHLGRPDGQKQAKYSLAPVAGKLSELLGRPVGFLPDCVGAEVERACAVLEPGEVVLLENLRFHIEEEGKVKREDGSSQKAEPQRSRPSAPRSAGSGTSTSTTPSAPPTGPTAPWWVWTSPSGPRATSSGRRSNTSTTRWRARVGRSWPSSGGRRSPGRST